MEIFAWISLVALFLVIASIVTGCGNGEGPEGGAKWILIDLALCVIFVCAAAVYLIGGLLKAHGVF